MSKVTNISTNIKISKDWKLTQPIQSNELLYDDMKIFDLHSKNEDNMPANLQNEMIKNIEKFGKKEHILIYKLIYDQYGKKIFSTNSIGLYFSLNQFNNSMK